MITRSSFLPVCGVIDWLRSTSLSRFKPSGVISNAQAKISAGSRPMTSTTMTMRTAVAPRPNAGNTVWATWINSHATARYAAPTRSTLRRRSSPMKDVVIVYPPAAGSSRKRRELFRPLRQPPLHHLAAAQPGPGALGCTLCRRVGQSTAPMASECSGLSAGACGKQVHSDLKAGGSSHLAKLDAALAAWARQAR